MPSTTNIPIPTSTPYDITQVVSGGGNCDKKVDGADFVVWLMNFGRNTLNKASDGDYNVDGKVDGADFVIWLVNYGT